MKRKSNFLVLFSVLMFFCMNIEKASAQTWEPTNGPFGGSIQCFAENSNYLFAGATGGVFSKGIFRSADHGANWMTINSGLNTAGMGKEITALGVSGSLVVASTGQGIYYSANNGDTWSISSYPGAYTPNVFYNVGTNLLAGGSSGLYVSTDNGLTWTSQNAGFQGITPPAVPEIRSFVMNGTTLYAGTYHKGIFRSTDNGLTWTTVNNGLGTVAQLNNRAFSSLGVRGTDVFAGTSGSGVFRLINNGDTWTREISSLPSSGNVFVHSLLVKDSYVFITTTTGLYRSNNSGTISWSLQTLSPTDLSVVKLFQSEADIFSSTNKGPYISVDNLINWTPASNGMLGLLVDGITTAGGTDMFALMNSGNFYRSSDFGQTWNIGNMAGSPFFFNNYLFLYYGYWIYRSADNGLTWQPIYEMGTLARFSSMGTTLFARITCCEVLYYSNDNGDTWTPSMGALSQILSMADDGTNLFAGTQQQGVIKSIDNGVNWTETSLPTDVPVRAVATNGTYVFAGTSNYYEDPSINPVGIYRSSDDGINWTLVNSGLGSMDIGSLAFNGPDLYAGTKSGVYKSTNNADSWTLVNEGFATPPNATSLYVLGNYLFSNNWVPSAGGPVYRRILSGTAPEQPDAIIGPAAPCIGSVETYSVTKVPGVTYAWQFPQGWTIVEGGTTNAVTVITGSISGFIIVTPSNGFGSGPVQVLPITPSQPLPVNVSIVASNNPTCPGTTVTFTATPVNGGSPSYQWFVNSIAVGENSAQFAYIPVNGDEIFVEMTSSLGCVSNNPAISNVIEISVIACEPWNFTITGQVHTINIPISANPNINGEPLAAGDWIGVFFVDDLGQDACAGAVEWNLAGVVINAYGNDPTTLEKDGFASGETFRWILFKSDTSTEYPAGATYDASMPNQGNFADFGLSKLTSLQVMYCQDYSFTSGWNSVSSFIVPFEPAVEALFAPMVNNLTILRNLTQLYWPTEGINTIGNFDNQSGYAIKTTGNVSFEICGSAFASSEVALEAGWHYLPVLSECPVNTMDLFGAHLADIVIVTDLIGTQVFWPAMEVYSLEYLQPGKAYKIKVLNPFTLIFPACNGKANYPAFDQLNSISTPWGNLEITPNAQTVAITTNAQAEMLKGDMVGAFDQNNKLCGFIEVPANGQPTAMILIGDDATTTIKDGFAEGENISYRIFRANTGEEFSLEVVYDAGFDNATGNYFTSSLSAINAVTMSVTGINNIGTSGISIYPNPATDFVVINIATENFAGATVTVNDTKGRTVIEKMIGSSNSKLDISNLGTGVYVISIKSDSINEISKLIVR